MDDIIKRILGEAKAEPDESKEPKDKNPKAEKEPAAEPEKKGKGENSSEHSEAPEEAEIDEVANLWAQGNRDDVAQRFMGMDNETAVKVVFAIGREGALELGRMVDEMLKRQGDQEGEGPYAPGAELPPQGGFGGEPSGDGPRGGETTEPARMEPAPGEDEGYPTRQIMGAGR